MRVLVTGSTGFIGSRVITALRSAAHSPIACTRSVHVLQPQAAEQTVFLDLNNLAGIAASIESTRPAAVIHCAAMRDLSQCEQEPELAMRINTDATRQIADACRTLRVRMVFVSTDQVFDGDRGMYTERDTRNPINVYGHTKALAEDAVLSLGSLGCIARVALTLGHTADGNRSPNEHVVSTLRAHKPCTLYSNEYRTPIHVDDVASALVECVTVTEPILHLGGPDRVSRVELGLAVARAYQLDSSLCTATIHNAQATGLRRALDTSLDTTLARQVLRSPPRALLPAISDLVRSKQPDSSKS